MKQALSYLLLLTALIACNPVTEEYSFIYNDEGPNALIADKMKALLESKYNVDINLIKGKGTNENLDRLLDESVDMALVENYVDYVDGLRSAFSVYSEVLHIFYQQGFEITSFEDLMYDHTVYVGQPASPTYNLTMDLLRFYGMTDQNIEIVADMGQAEVVVLLTNLLSTEELSRFDGYRLFSFDRIEQFGNGSTVEGLSLRFPRLSPFVLPKNAYRGFSDMPIVTLSVDLVMIVRSGMGEVAVTDLTKTMLRNRQIFTSIDPLLYDGLREDFDQSQLNIPLHEGARIFLDRDEPSFFERYAELAGLTLSIIIAVWSGLVSFARWRKQKKKDKIDTFYADLMHVKKSIAGLEEKAAVLAKAKQVHALQNRAFELLINEELEANESFRIFMEMVRDILGDLRSKLRRLS